MSNQMRIRILCAVLVLGLGLAACGGGSESPLPPTAAAVRAETVATPTVPPAPTVPPTPTVAPAPTVAATPTLTADDHVQRGVVLAKEGKLDEAIVELQAALQLDPEHPLAHANLGAIYANQGKTAEAVAEIEKSLERDPDNARAYSNLCHLYNLQGRTEQAMAACEQALSLDPGYSSAYTNLGVLYLGAQDYDRAISAFSRAIELDPENTLARKDLGNAYTQTGELDAAIAVLQEALRLDPAFADAMVNLGLAYNRAGAFDLAIAEYKEAIRLRPDYADAHLNLAITYRTLGQNSAAIAEFETFLQLDPNSSKVVAVKNDIAAMQQREVVLSAEYGNSFAGYRLRYPEGWTHLEGEPGTVVFTSNSGAEGAPLFGVASIPLQDLGQGVDLSGVTTVEELVVGMATNYHVDPQQMSPFLLAGQPALVGDWETGPENRKKVGKIGFFVYRGLGYVVMSVAAPDQWAGFQPLGLAMLGSLAMVEPDVSAEYGGEAYSLRYPAGWVYEDKAALTTFTPLPGLTPDEAPYLAVLVGEKNIAQSFKLQGPFSASAVIAAFVQLLDAQAGEPVERTFGDQAALAVDFEAEENGVPIAGTLVLLMQTREPMAVLGAAPGPRWDSFAGTFAAMMSSLAPAGAAAAGSGVDMEDPVSVLQAVFAAARSQDFSGLSALCDPLGENDDDTALICAMTADHPERDSFVTYFAAGTVAGEAVIQGDRAQVPFLFGPQGDQPESMVLVRRDSKWYLAEF
jgi:tetratricopeptide (TPR) repeat protein